MDKQKIEQASNIINSINDDIKVKHIKNNQGLIEKINLNEVILTEDNKILLKD
jgi:hypothetical protein